MSQQGRIRGSTGASGWGPGHKMREEISLRTWGHVFADDAEDALLGPVGSAD